MVVIKITKNEQQSEKPRLFELWDQIINGSEKENKKEAGK